MRQKTIYRLRLDTAYVCRYERLGHTFTAGERITATSAIEPLAAGWAWSSEADRAVKIEGRKLAELCARRLETWAREMGGGEMRLAIVPASGGMAITRRDHAHHEAAQRARLATIHAHAAHHAARQGLYLRLER